MVSLINYSKTRPVLILNILQAIDVLSTANFLWLGYNELDAAIYLVKALGLHHDVSRFAAKLWALLFVNILASIVLIYLGQQLAIIWDPHLITREQEPALEYILRTKDRLGDWDEDTEHGLFPPGGPPKDLPEGIRRRTWIHSLE